MFRRPEYRWVVGKGRSFMWAWVLGAGLALSPARAEPPPCPPDSPPPILSLEAAVNWALQHNPSLAAIRQQHGIAAAAVVIARTYPFNPVWTNKVFADNGPESAGVSNRVSMEQRVSLDLEVRGQGKFRRQAANAALSRTDLDIVFQEETLALRVIRAFNALLYALDRFHLGEETVRLDEQVAEQVRDAVEHGLLKAEDLIVARSEVASAGALLGAARANLQRAEQELRLAMGLTCEPVAGLQGTLERPSPPCDAEALLALALERRTDLRARDAAVKEAQARFKLAVADRFGNPNLGPDFEYNETRVYFIGAQMTLPLPVLNTHRGEILQRKAELQRATLDFTSTEVAVRQAVAGALARLHQAQAWADNYRTQVLPTQKALGKEMETLNAQGRVDVLKVIDLRRKLLQARGGYLDALYEVSQAQADLAAAVGDLTIVLPPCGENTADAPPQPEANGSPK